MPESPPEDQPVDFRASNPHERSRERIFGVGLNTRNLIHSIDFYTQFLGMYEADRVLGPDLTEVILRSPAPGSTRLLLLCRHDELQSEESTSAQISQEVWGRIVFEVVGIEGVRDRLMAAGHAVGELQQAGNDYSFSGPAPTFAYAFDPDGHPIELIEIERT